MKNNYFKKNHTKHHDQSDCGVVCLQTILKYYNSNYSLEKLREYSGTTKQGTTMLGLMQCGNKIGLEIKGYESTIEALKKNKIPTILHTLFEEKLQHFIVCFGYDYKKGKFLISNPTSSKIEYINENELGSIWQSKALLLCNETEKLLKKEVESKQKWQWIYEYVKEDLNLLSMSLFLGIILAILSLATAVYSQKLIDVLLPSNDSFKITASICLLFFLFSIQVFFGYLRGLFLIRQTKSYNIRVIHFFYNNLLKLPKMFFDTRKIGDMVARMNDTSRIQRTISKIIGSIVIDILLVIIVSIAIFNYNTTLGYITLSWIPLLTVVVLFFSPKIKQQQEKVMQSYSRNESNYIDTIKGVETIKNNNKETFFAKETNSIYKLFQNAIYDLNRLSLNYATISELISNFFIIGTLGYSVYLVLNNELTAGVIIAILQLVGMLMASTSNLALVNIEIQEAKVAFNRMYEFTSIEEENKGSINISKFNSLEIKNLSFRFAGRKELFKNINISVNKNEYIAIVGESGSGKSTLGQVLQKFYPFENGEIIVNNEHNLPRVDTEDWRNIIGVIPQDITIFSGNVVSNILLGKEDTPENIQKFCKEYGFTEFINSLPQGFATILGEEGINLSGGQKQIIAFMRVLYKKPQLVLLDEFTSAMDRKTEKFVLNLLKRLKSELSIIFISHRLHSLPQIADKIYVLEDGTTDIQGSHQQLLETSNFYSDYWKELV
ncbi:peptidase domain-containing ABC transporter [uncultured Polaribacter sp.]|uniref:peptidase domain-containing ABC transporter n=1 Tax=uncultured Polaribacter sp. TaxID=174711 RepID=UPI0026319A26|nr:peptidase domain-containing ABC transporter [uncultured Polaribacter sp.]